ncbi:tetratricopeptide repeat family protein (plasmid) [Burkholderia humptydooensis]|nr:MULTISPECIES: tetratricopeptide repeat protein [Burkholderia]AJY38291.1 tetratricopeptide repeat family protein [Burkholderia sp. 2002721687]
MVGCTTGSFHTRSIAAQTGPQPAADLRVAESALSAGDATLAATLFDKVLAADPNSLPAQLGLGDAMYQNGDLARAGVLYAQAAAAAPADPRPQLGLARVALRERQLDVAQTLYRQLLAAHPDNPLAAEGLGTVLDLQGRHGEAQAVYRAALRLHPQAYGLRSNLGLSLILDHRAREGANVLLEVTGVANAPREARQNLALAYGLLGNDEAARRILLADMPAALADDNIRFYRSIREKLVAPSPDSSARGDAGAVQRGAGTGRDAARAHAVPPASARFTGDSK